LSWTSGEIWDCKAMRTMYTAEKNPLTGRGERRKPELAKGSKVPSRTGRTPVVQMQNQKWTSSEGGVQLCGN